MLSCVDLHYQFNERNKKPLFSGLHFEVVPTQCLQITGNNGSGKTTLLQLLAGLRWIETGQILWQNQPIQNCKSQYAQVRFYLGHKSSLKPELTVLENLAFFHALHRQPQKPPKYLLDAVKLWDLRNTPSYQLSVGQQKRLLLSQLITMQARLWILDEPFSSLDQEAQGWLQNLILQHLAKKGLVILTSHQPVNFSKEILHLS